MDEERSSGTPAGDPGDTSVRDTYDRISEHFASTREYPWPEVTAFLGGEPAGNLDPETAAALGDGASVVDGAVQEATEGGSGRLGLDVGCGNGRHCESLAGVVERVVGVDASRGLLDTARERARNRGFDDALGLVQADAATLPLRADVVGVAVYVATLHHLRPRARRVASLSELARVLAPGGRALVSAWSTAHDRFDETAGFDTTVPWTLPGGERVDRFYHIYDPAEFEADLTASDLDVVASVVSSGNCYAVVEAESAATTV
ncbi:class I SAM-dependent methyltransferase [Halobellus salinisoli]|uniref:class I SAM-dependent methyltransferase n=1 Tax=Halobellus salinisoli TaxID=3108500 RepID=UPI003008DC76